MVTKRLTVAVDARFAASSGIGVYLRNVLTRLYVLRPNWRFRLLGTPERSRAVLERSGQAETEPFDAPYYSIAEQARVRGAVGLEADLVWSPHYNAAIFAAPPLLTTIHDVNHLAVPQFIRGVHRRLYARFMFEAVRRRSDGLLFVSEFSRGEFARLVGRSTVPSWITPNAVDESWVGPIVETHALGSAAIRPYLIFVGNVKPHKNLVGLLHAYELLNRRGADVDLVIVGRREGFLQGDGEAVALADRIGAGRIRFTGHVDDAALKQLVTGARALALPSFYEGFGLPPLEAMAVGCPTVVARAGALPEVCGEASEYVDPHDPRDIARGLERVLSDAAYADRLRLAGRDRVSHFNWNATAETVALAMEAVARVNRQASVSISA